MAKRKITLAIPSDCFEYLVTRVKLMEVEVGVCMNLKISDVVTNLVQMFF